MLSLRVFPRPGSDGVQFNYNDWEDYRLYEKLLAITKHHVRRHDDFDRFSFEILIVDDNPF